LLFVNPSASQLASPVSGASANLEAVEAPVTFDEAYKTCFAFVYRTVRRLGVREASVDDVVQEVFLVVHRRLDRYEPRVPFRGWVYGILSHVVRTHRRTIRRKELPFEASEMEAAQTIAVAPASLEPARLAEQHEALSLLLRLLDKMDEDKREVLVLSELEQMTVPEIADTIGANLNTVYSRLKAAKKGFAEIYAREKVRTLRRGGT
jgi:RNA polymerase sigma-70 factor, ECF subfamily